MRKMVEFFEHFEPGNCLFKQGIQKFSKKFLTDRSFVTDGYKGRGDRSLSGQVRRYKK